MTKGAKPDAWMPLYIGDYLADTARLTTEQHGAYLLLIMDYWRNGPPVDDDDELAEITRLDGAKWRRMRPKIARFFTIIDGHWTQKRIAEELTGAQARSDKAALKAQAAANARWNKETGKGPQKQQGPDAPSIPTSMLEECPSPSPSPPSEERDTNASLSSSDDEKPSLYPEPFAAAWKAYPHVRGRSSKPKALGLWRRLSPAVRSSLPDAVARYAREGREPKMDCGAPAMDRWLRDSKFEDWLSASPPQPSRLAAPADPWPSRLRSWQASRYWNTVDWGPKPGATGCLVPAELLQASTHGAAIVVEPNQTERRAG